MSGKPLRILFAIAEAYPFIKVGGLADVGASLPKALARLGHDVRLVLPGYSCVGAGRPTVSLEIPMGQETELAHLDHHGVHGGVSVYTVGNESYFDREAAYGGYEDDDVAYQGHFGPEAEALAGMEDGEGSMLARGIAFADAVNTVSRSYLEEILTVEHGMGMDGLLRSRTGALYGILNGVDYEEFAPATDPYIA